MNRDRVFQQARALSRSYRVTSGAGFRLAKFDPRDTGAFGAADEPRAQDALARCAEVLDDLQARLYAEDQWAVLLLFQAMDAAGKDSAIKHVLSGVNPMAFQVFSFRAPSEEELDHDFLWRCAKALPERGRIGVFNRSYYEETLVVRVHPELLAAQRIPPKLLTKRIWKERFEDIRAFERHLARSGSAICKFFLYVSKGEQRKRFLARLEKPRKHWKFSVDDVAERQRWKEYMRAYEEAIRETASPAAPWYVVPADHKWYTHIVVAAAIIDTLASLGLRFPRISGKKLKERRAAKRLLERGG